VSVLSGGFRPFVAGVLAAYVFGGCTAGREPLAVPEGAGVEVPAEAALSFQRRAEGFYLRLAGRRFNTLETFNDFILRDHFETLDLFYDYYADLAQALRESRFEKSRPEQIRIEEFAFDNVRTARVMVYFEGADGRPLRPGRADLFRVDQWEWIGGTWWIRPGKL